MKKVEFSFRVERGVLKQVLPDYVVDQDFQEDEYITHVIGRKAGFDLTDDWVVIFKEGKIVFAFPIYRDSNGQLCIVRNGKLACFNETNYELLSFVYMLYLDGFAGFPVAFNCISWYFESIHSLVNECGGRIEYSNECEALERYHFAGKIIEQF